jgi:hypothetical protein
MPLRPSSWLAAALAGATAAASAQSVAPPPWPAAQGDPPALAADPVRPLKLGSLRVTLDASTLADVQRAIGLGETTRHGKGTEALDWLCYTVADAEPAQRLWLTSSELARGSRIDGVTAIELAAGTRPEASCPELPAKFRPIRFEDGLWLGALGADHRRAMGLSGQGSGDWGGTYRGSLGSLDVVGTISVEVRRARAVAIHAAHTAQN